jgi:hypothetical protein
LHRHRLLLFLCLRYPNPRRPRFLVLKFLRRPNWLHRLNRLLLNHQLSRLLTFYYPCRRQLK